MKVDQVALRRRMAQLSVEELTRMLEVDSRNYNAEALSAAAEELKSRETPEKTLNYLPGIEKTAAHRPVVETTERYITPALEPEGRRPRPARTWRVVALVGTAAIAVAAVAILMMERRLGPSVERRSPVVSGDRLASPSTVLEAGAESSPKAAMMEPVLGQTLDGCYATRANDSASKPVDRIAFRKDGTFVEKQSRGRNVVETSGTYRIDGASIELAHAGGEVRRASFGSGTEGQIQIDTVTFLPDQGCE
jgi:hypothetical protein